MYHRHKYVSLNFNIPDVIDRLAHALASRFTSGDAELTPDSDTLPPAADETAGQGLTGFTQAQEQPDPVAYVKSNAADHMPQSSSAPATPLKSGSISDSDRITNDINKSYGTMSKSDWNKFLSERPRFKTQYAAVTNKVNELAKTGSPLPNIKGAFNDPNVSYVRNLNRVLSQTPAPAPAPEPEFDWVSHDAAKLGREFGYMSADDWDSFLKAHKGFKTQYRRVYDYVSNLKAEGKPLPNVASAFKSPGSWVRDFNIRLRNAEHVPAPEFKFTGPGLPAEDVHSNIEAWKKSPDYVDSIRTTSDNPPMFTRRSLYQGMLPHEIREQILSQQFSPAWKQKLASAVRTFYYQNDLLEGKNPLPEGYTLPPETVSERDPVTGNYEGVPKGQIISVKDPENADNFIQKKVLYNDFDVDDKENLFSPQQINELYGKYQAYNLVPIKEALKTNFYPEKVLKRMAAGPLVPGVVENADYDALYKANPEHAAIPYSRIAAFFKKYPEYRPIAYADAKQFQQLFLNNPELADEITGKHVEYVPKIYQGPQGEDITVKIPKDIYERMNNPEYDYIKVPKEDGGSVWTPVSQWKQLRAQGYTKVPNWGETPNYPSGGKHS